MKVIRNIVSQLHIYIIWLILSALIWGWIFTFITDTVPSKKVTIFTDTYACRDTELAVRLEEDRPQGIKMIKVHPFSYAMFDDSVLLNADIYIIKKEDIETYMSSFCAIDGAVPQETEAFYLDGKAYGLKVYDATTGVGVALDYLTYTAEGTLDQDYYLFFNKNSVHIKSLNGSTDDAALAVAERLMHID